ncbi:MAG: hypothetical protein HN738_02575 [Gammaproteobacteria bacterium]|jgi:hypothetical protein|nr:hypothetical protein [Gammaproteobacteria bacterium]
MDNEFQENLSNVFTGIIGLMKISDKKTKKELEKMALFFIQMEIEEYKKTEKENGN